jgi:hypothetical protein
MINLVLESDCAQHDDRPICGRMDPPAQVRRKERKKNENVSTAHKCLTPESL